MRRDLQNEENPELTVAFSGGNAHSPNPRDGEIGAIDFFQSTAAAPVENWASFSILDSSVVLNQGDGNGGEQNAYQVYMFPSGATPIDSSPDLSCRHFEGDFPRPGCSDGQTRQLGG